MKGECTRGASCTWSHGDGESKAFLEKCETPYLLLGTRSYWRPLALLLGAKDATRGSWHRY